MATLSLVPIASLSVLLCITSTALQAVSPIYPHTAEQWERALALPRPDSTNHNVNIYKNQRYENKGITLTSPQKKNIVIQQDPPVAANVLFEFDAATVRTNINPDLDGLGQALHHGGLRTAVLVIEGHTDAIGATQYNILLSQRRAIAVQIYLMQQHGIAQERLLTQGYGEARPIATNDTVAGRATNRRVEFKRIR